MYLPSRKACKFFGVCANTLRTWANAGKIKYIKTPAGQRLFDCSEFEKQNTNYKKSYCYCRVSSYKQKDDLERQKEYLQKKYPNHIIVSDVGSGLNFKRKQLLFLLEEASNGRVEEIVVAYRDRLCRFGFDLIDWYCKKFNVKLTVLDKTICSPKEEFITDLLSIITIFSYKVHGLQKYKDKIKEEENIIEEETEESKEEA